MTPTRKKPYIGQLIRHCINGVPHTTGPAMLSYGVWEITAVNRDGTVNAKLGHLTRIGLQSWVDASVGSSAWETRAGETTRQL